MDRNNWVVRYCHLDSPKKVQAFSKFKDSGEPGYAFKYENIHKFKTVREAFDVAKKLSETGKYKAVVNRIHKGKEETYYFSGLNL